VHKAGAGGGVGRLKDQIFAVGVGGFGFVLGVQRLRQAQRGGGRGWLDVEDAAKFCFGVGGAFEMEIKLREMQSGFGVARIETHCAFERFGCAGEVARMLLRYAQENSRAASGGFQLNQFAERRNCGGGFGFAEQDAEVEVGFRHFAIDGDGAFVFGASFGGSFQRGVGVSELEVGVGYVGFFGQEFLQGRDGGFEIVFVDVVLGVVQEIV
jgi:hypothetical protein